MANFLPQLIIVIFTISIISAFLDKFISKPQLISLRQKSKEIWLRIYSDPEGLIQDANDLYCSLFDSLYGEKILSWYRVRSSCISTLLGLVFFTLILGFENTFWEKILHVINNDYAKLKHKLFFSSFPIILNFIPDFFSLWETRIILQISKGKNCKWLYSLILVDFILTSLVFSICGLIFVFVSNLVIDDFRINNGFLGLVRSTLDSKKFLIFYLTTFITSFFWVIHLSTFSLINILNRISILSKKISYQISNSDYPISATSGYISTFLVIIYIISIFF